MSCAAALSIRRGFAGEAAGAYSSKRNERPGTREQSKESGHDAKIPRHRRNKRRRWRTSKKISRPKNAGREAGGCDSPVITMAEILGSSVFFLHFLCLVLVFSSHFCVVKAMRNSAR